MRRNTYINNLKMLVLAGLVLGKSDVTNLASDVDNPDDLRDKCPRTYEYYDRIIRSYEDTYGVSRVRSR